MTEINKTLEVFDYFHDWYVTSIVLGNEVDSACPDAMVLALKLGDRRVEVLFHGMTRLGIENGGTVNIVLSMEHAQPDTQVDKIARDLLSRSLRGKRIAEHIVYVHPTAGFAIAVEFDEIEIREFDASSDDVP